MPSVQDFESRLRHEARQTLAPHVQSLKEELQTLESRLSASLREFEQKIGLLDVVDFSAAVVAMREALDHVSAKSIEDSNGLAQFARDMRRSETQEDILTLLLDRSLRYAPRVTLFVLRGEQLAAWAARGYSEDVAAAIASQPFPVSDSHLLSRALDEDGAVSSSDISAESRLVPLLHEEQPGPWHAFPLKALRRPVAVLLATAAEGRECELQQLSAMIEITGLCIENVALKILQQLKASGAPGVRQERAPTPPPRPPAPEPVVQAQPVQPVSEPAFEAAPASPAAPEVAEEPAPDVVHEQPVPEAAAPKDEAVVEAVPPVEPDPVVESVVQEIAVAEVPSVESPAAVETPTVEPPAVEEPVSAAAPEEPHAPPVVVEEIRPEPVLETPVDAAVPLEVQEVAAHVPEPVPPEPVPVPEIPVQPPLVVAAGTGGSVTEQVTVVTGPVLVHPAEVASMPKPAAPREVQKPSEEEKLHSDAKRFARLLVSEIKLYNEQRVVEGRANRDVYVRLKRDIDRSRDMYEKRVSPAVSRRVDYFHDEIVRILGENDASALGSDYPGPRVES